MAAVSGVLCFAAVSAVLLFRAMPEAPQSAGQLAADLFVASYVLCALIVALALCIAPKGRWIGVGMGLVLALQWLEVVPALRHHGAGWPGSFASLHAMASGCHFALALGTASWAIWLVGAPRLSAAPSHY